MNVENNYSLINSLHIYVHVFLCIKCREEIPEFIFERPYISMGCIVALQESGISHETLEK